MLGIVRPARGTVRYEGSVINDVSTAERVRRGIAPVPEAGACFLATQSTDELVQRYLDEISSERTREEYALLADMVRGRLLPAERAGAAYYDHAGAANGLLGLITVWFGTTF